MKILLPLLVLSIIANVVLAFQPTRRSRVTTNSSSTLVPAQSHSGQSTAPATPAETIELPADLRGALATRNPKELLHALRRAGFPERYARDMVMAEINATRSARLRDSLEREASTPFWQLGAERIRKMRESAELQREHRAILREVFDGRPPAGTFEAAYHGARYRFLPADKAARMAQIDADYAEVFSNTMLERGPGPIDPGVMKLLNEEHRADLAQLLSPQEIELYDLHLSSSAQILRRTLGEFQPTEAEFRALVAARRPIDEESGNSSLGNVTFISSRTDSRILENYARVLPPERYAELIRTQDRGYRAAAEIARHYNLPANAATETYVIQQSYEQRIRDARSAAGHDRAAGEAAVRALAAEARTALSKVLGDAGTDVYLETGGAWLGSILRPPSSPSRIPNTESAIRLPGGG